MFRFKRKINIQLIRKQFIYLLNAIFPVHCSCCRQPLTPLSAPPYLCKECFMNIPLIKNKKCTKCGKSLDILPSSLTCFECSSGQKLPFNDFYAPLNYSSYGRAIVHNLKFHATPSAAKTIGELIYAKLASNNLLDKFDAFIPAPISKKRLKKRSYNQTELICKYLSKKTGIPTINALKKIRNTKPQSELTKKERLTNLDGSIIFNTKSKIPESIAFVDDVYTTGTTAKHCCNTLKKNGAKKLYVLCACINSKAD